MQHTVSIMIPDFLEPSLQRITNFENFVNRLIIHALKRRETRTQHVQLEQAARLMLPDYTHDEELTCFTALDGESFV